VPIEQTEGMSDDIKNTLDRVNLIIRENGTFSMVLHGLPIEGDWSTSRQEIQLTPKRVLDRPIDQLGESMQALAKPYVLEDQSGHVSSSSFGHEKITLTKTSEAAQSR